MPQELYENFDRQYRLKIGQNNSTGIEIGKETAGHPALHISFSLDKTENKAKNNGKIDIWNLSKENIARLKEKNCKISLSAGYGDNLHLIFAGEVSFVKTARDNADYKTSIEVVDCLSNVRDSYVSLNYQGQVSWKTILDDTAKQLGVGSITYSEDAQFTSLSNGFSFVGQAKDILTKGCNCCGMSWDILNGVLRVKRIGGAMTGQTVYLLSPQTGLLGSPEEVKESKHKDTDKQEEFGYEVQYFMNAAIDVGHYVRVESREVKGNFRVKKVTVSGDNVSGDWSCKATLMEVK